MREFRLGERDRETDSKEGKGEGEENAESGADQ